MRAYDVKIPVTLIIRVSAESAAQAASLMHGAFQASNPSDPLALHDFSYDVNNDTVNAVGVGTIMTCVVDVPEHEIEVELN